jgi:hypothetical protein
MNAKLCRVVMARARTAAALPKMSRAPVTTSAAANHAGQESKATHFGFQTVTEEQKVQKGELGQKVGCVSM